MKRILSFLLAMMMAVPLLAPDVSAASNSVKVTIPTFKVTVNDAAVNSTQLQYPLIVYNNITYFPLTLSWCNELGLAFGYTSADGLYVAKGGVVEGADTAHSRGYQTAGSKHTATIADYPIHINGQRIDNSKEQYPLLNFRNITYFPLTWRFVADEFGWDQAWGNKSGYTLSTYGRAAEPPAGTQYYEESLYFKEDYRNYAILEHDKQEVSVVASDTASGGIGYEQSAESLITHCKLDYATDTLSEVSSAETADTPYRSGAVKEEDVSDLFSANGSVLCFRGNALQDVTQDAPEAGMTIDTVYAAKYTVNGLNIYRTMVYLKKGEPIPAPYTPCVYYAFIDYGDGVLQRVKSWPVDQVLTAVYPSGASGVYLCSSTRIGGSHRTSNGRSWICTVGGDGTETTLNGRWPNWNSLRAIGMDDAGNLYLLNTLFADREVHFDIFNSGNVDPVRDGYYRLAPDGTLAKVYPFIQADELFVTPAGEIYIRPTRMNEIWHLQTGARIRV